jgi:hypothetical protein
MNPNHTLAIVAVLIAIPIVAPRTSDGASCAYDYDHQLCVGTDAWTPLPSTCINNFKNVGCLFAQTYWCKVPGTWLSSCTSYAYTCSYNRVNCTDNTVAGTIDTECPYISQTQCY